MYRIISGRWKSKRISAPKNFDVRPTTDFAKEALFSIIENRFDFDEEFISVLDLFAGIGSISLEFASRGCKDVTSVEMNPKHAAFINSTAAELDMSLQINVQRGDVFEYLKKNRNRKTYELVVADPPERLVSPTSAMISAARRKSGIWPNTFLRSRPLRSNNNVVGVPRIA